MSSDQDFIDAIALRYGDEANDSGSSPYVIRLFPDGILFTSTGAVHEGRLESILAEHDESDAVWASEEDAYCMLIRTEETSELVFGIRDSLTENHAEDEHIDEDDLSHVYGSIDDYILETGAVSGAMDADEYAPDDWEEEEESESEDDEPDWDDQGENY